MDYTNTYMRARNLAENVRQAASQGSAPRGLASRKSQMVSGGDEELIDFPTLSLASISDMFGDVDKSKLQLDMGTSEIAPIESVRPISKEDYFGNDALEGDLEFEDAVDRLLAKYPGMEKSELYRVIKKESGWDPTVVNEYNMAGLFQISPDSAKMLGTTTEEIAMMSPSEQVDLYGRYLETWNYTPDYSLGLMQAAPALAGSGPDTVVYKKGSKAWEANPAWRPEDGGDITVASINRFY